MAAMEVQFGEKRQVSRRLSGNDLKQIDPENISTVFSKEVISFMRFNKTQTYRNVFKGRE